MGRKKTVRRKPTIDLLKLISCSAIVAPHAGAWIETYFHISSSGIAKEVDKNREILVKIGGIGTVLLSGIVRGGKI